MVSIWAAIATAIGGQGIPKIVELLEDKPSVEQVQAIVTEQVGKVTAALNQTIAISKERGPQLLALEQLVARLEGQLEVLRTQCCNRGGPHRTRAPETALPPPPVKAMKDTLEEALKPVPAFNVQQQLQVQTP